MLRLLVLVAVLWMRAVRGQQNPGNIFFTGPLVPAPLTPAGQPPPDGVAQYSYGYKTEDPAEVTYSEQNEQRAGNAVTGFYSTLLPDGRVQMVNYVADENGYRATITYQTPGGVPLPSPLDPPGAVPQSPAPQTPTLRFAGPVPPLTADIGPAGTGAFDGTQVGAPGLAAGQQNFGGGVFGPSGVGPFGSLARRDLQAQLALQPRVRQTPSQRPVVPQVSRPVVRQVSQPLIVATSIKDHTGSVLSNGQLLARTGRQVSDEDHEQVNSEDQDQQVRQQQIQQRQMSGGESQEQAHYRQVGGEDPYQQVQVLPTVLKVGSEGVHQQVQHHHLSSGEPPRQTSYHQISSEELQRQAQQRRSASTLQDFLAGRLVPISAPHDQYSDWSPVLYQDIA